MLSRVPTYCALCVARCGATAVVEDGVLRSLEPDPTHPTGQALCIKGKVRVVCGQHGWWQACAALDAPGYDPFGTDSANINLLVTHDETDPTSGSVPLRSYPCNITRR